MNGWHPYQLLCISQTGFYSCSTDKLPGNVQMAHHLQVGYIHHSLENFGKYFKALKSKHKTQASKVSEFIVSKRQECLCQLEMLFISSFFVL